MAMADEFRAMTQDIAASYDVRMGEFAAIRQQVSEMLGDFRKTRLDETKRFNADRKAEVSDLLGSFRKEREEMGAAWHDLISSMRTKSGRKPQHTAKKSQQPHKKRAQAGA